MKAFPNPLEKLLTMVLLDKRKRAEKERRESEERLHAILDNSLASIYIKDLEGRYTYVNSGPESVLNLSKEQILGKTDYELLPKELAEVLREKDQRVLETGASLNEEESILREDGLHTYISTKFPLRDPDGNIYAVCGISTDITEQRRVREKLQESESRLAEAQRVARIGSWEHHVPANTTIWSEELYYICGLEPQPQGSTPFETFAELVHPDDAELVRGMIEKVFEDHEPLAYEHRLIRPDGEVRTLHVKVEMFVDEVSEPVRIVGTIQDVTEQRRAEEESRLLRTVALEVGGSEDLDSAMRVVLRRVCEATGWAIGQAWIPKAEGRALECSPAWYARDESLTGFRIANQDLIFETDDSLPGRAWSTKQPVWSRDITESTFTRAPIAAEFGLRAAMDIPVLADSEVVAVLDFFVFEQREEDERLVELVSGVAAQLGSTIQRKRTEEQLRKSEARNRAIVDTASDAIITMSEDGLVRSFNRAAEDIFGYSSEEIVGQPLRVLMPERLRKLHEVGFRRYLKSGEAHVIGRGPIELAGLRKNGEEFPLELSLAQVREEDEVLFTGIIRDISDRKQVEEELRTSEAGLAEAQRIAHLGSWEADFVTREMHWSDEMYRILGFAPGEVTPSREILEKATHPQDRELVPEAIRNAIEKRQSFNFEHRLLWSDGEVRFVQAQGEAVYDPSGRPIKLIGTSLDITERKQAEEELRRSERRLLAAQRIAHVGNWSFDVIENKAHWSDEMYRIFGLEPQEGSPLTYKEFLRRVHPEDRKLIQEASREALSGESRSSLDYRAVRPDGEVRFVHSQYEIEHDASVQVVELVGTLQDVTELRQTEQALRQLGHQNELILNSAGEGIYGLDLQGNTTFANPAAAQMVGWEVEELIGRPQHETIHHSKPDGTPHPREECLIYAGQCLESCGFGFSIASRAFIVR